METVDDLAFIGRNPGNRNVYVATGDSGMGMTHGTIAGIILADLLNGVEVPWAKLYSPSRKSLKAAGEYTRENANVAWQYTDWVKGGEVESADQVREGSGAIMRRGMHKIAVYRDAEGQVHELSARCTHLGCPVHWNDADKSWDCKCHGSRFDALGHVLSGPATKSLEALDDADAPLERPPRPGQEPRPSP
jgi:Rieske Fe-S protein